MANKKHVALLKQGVEAWNAWRCEHPKVCPDLFGAALFGADLSDADLTHSLGWLAGIKRPETIERQRRSLSRA